MFLFLLFDGDERSFVLATGAGIAHGLAIGLVNLVFMLATGVLRITRILAILQKFMEGVQKSMNL